MFHFIKSQDMNMALTACDNYSEILTPCLFPWNSFFWRFFLSVLFVAYCQVNRKNSEIINISSDNLNRILLHQLSMRIELSYIQFDFFSRRIQRPSKTAVQCLTNNDCAVLTSRNNKEISVFFILFFRRASSERT